MGREREREGDVLVWIKWICVKTTGKTWVGLNELKFDILDISLIVFVRI